MNIAKLRSYLEELSKDTFYGDLDKAEVVRGLIELDSYVPKDVNENVVLSGTTAATTTSYLNYGVNSVTTASATANAIKLPYPPQKGKQVIIVNTSDRYISVYPSVINGSINGTVNGFAWVPNDGKAYTFYCYENPLPGAWSWTPPAINQYDSGIITATAPGSNGTIVSAGNGSPIAIGGIPQFPGLLDGRNLPAIYGNSAETICFKPATPWNSITKFKIYTNQTTLGSGITARIDANGYFNYYEKSTGAYFTFKQYQYNSAVLDDPTFSRVTGSPATTPVSANIGDPGTYYGEISSSLSVPVPTINYSGSIWSYALPTFFGDKYCGDETIDGVVYERWYTQYLRVSVTPRVAVGSQFKYRFFIEYN